MTETEYRKKYEDNAAYMKWLGVSESDYVTDCVIGKVKRKLTNMTNSESIHDGYDEFRDEMHIKYNAPLEGYLKKKGIQWKDYLTLPLHIQELLCKYEIDRVSYYGSSDSLSISFKLPERPDWERHAYCDARQYPEIHEWLVKHDMYGVFRDIVANILEFGTDEEVVTCMTDAFKAAKNYKEDMDYRVSLER